jgi:hypothetical protein
VSFRATEQANSYAFSFTVPQRTPARVVRDTWTITLDVDGEQHVQSVPVSIILSKEE